MKNVKVSVIMGIYNCSKYLPFAIESIINQTFTDWELIMCDDASTDDTYQIAKYYEQLYPEKITIIKNDKNCKLSYTLNRCLNQARGIYIARMDADDLCDKKRFELQVNFLDSNPDISVVGTYMQRFNDNGLADIVEIKERPNYYTLRYSLPFHHATIMMRKEAYDLLNGYTVSNRTVRGQDYDLWFRFFSLGLEGANIPIPLYYVREDMDAIKRRTFKVRFNTYRTTCYGFKLLKYPKFWIIRPTLEFIFKSLVPYAVIAQYRKWQKYRFLKKKENY